MLEELAVSIASTIAGSARVVFQCRTGDLERTAIGSIGGVGEVTIQLELRQIPTDLTNLTNTRTVQLGLEYKTAYHWAGAYRDRYNLAISFIHIGCADTLIGDTVGAQVNFGAFNAGQYQIGTFNGYSHLTVNRNSVQSDFALRSSEFLVGQEGGLGDLDSGAKVGCDVLCLNIDCGHACGNTAVRDNSPQGCAAIASLFLSFGGRNLYRGIGVCHGLKNQVTGRIIEIAIKNRRAIVKTDLVSQQLSVISCQWHSFSLLIKRG